MVIINCLVDGPSYNPFHYVMVRSHLDEVYKVAKDGEKLIIRFKLDAHGDECITIRFVDSWTENIDVCLLYVSINPKFDKVLQRASLLNQRFPSLPKLLIGAFAERKNRLDVLQKALIHDRIILNRDIGNRLANHLMAIKYIEYNHRTGRGLKILLNEIAYARLAVLKEEQDSLKRSKRCCSII